MAERKTKAQIDSERLGFITVERYEELMAEALLIVAVPCGMFMLAALAYLCFA